jgi:hypothetical protein
MNRHASRWGIIEAAPGPTDDELPERWQLITWTDVVRWARQVSSENLSPIQDFLVQQLIEFLGFAGLSVSWVYEPQHFEFFEKELKERDDEVKNEIRARLASIWERIKEQIGPERFARTLGEIYVGNLGSKADHGWAQTHADDGSGLPNLTIEVNSDEAMVNLVGWFDWQLAKTRQMLGTDDGRQFVTANPEYELVIFKRKGHPSKDRQKVVWQGARHELVSRTPFSGSSSEELIELIDDFKAGLKPKFEKASIHIRRSWPKEVAILNPNLPAQMAKEVQLLLPILDVARSPQKGS